VAASAVWCCLGAVCIPQPPPLSLLGTQGGGLGSAPHPRPSQLQPSPGMRLPTSPPWSLGTAPLPLAAKPGLSPKAWPGKSCPVKPCLTQIVFPPQSPALPRARGPVRFPKGNPRPSCPAGTSPCRPLTGFLQQRLARGLAAGRGAALPTRARLALQPRVGNPASRGTGLELGVNRGLPNPPRTRSLRNGGGCCANSCLLRDVQHAFHPQQRRTRCSRNPALQTTAGPAQPPPRRPPGCWPEGDGPGCSQPPRSPDSPSKGFLPQTSRARAPAPRPEQAGLLAGAVRAHGSPGWGAGPVPTAAGLGQGSCPCDISPGCSNPQYCGTEERGSPAVYQPEREYLRVAMATWASPWEPEGRQRCRDPAGHKQPLPSPAVGYGRGVPMSRGVGGTVRPTPAHTSPGSAPRSAGKGSVPEEAPSLPLCPATALGTAPCAAPGAAAPSREQGWSRRVPMTVLSVPLWL